MTVFYRVASFLCNVVFSIFFDIHIEGVENVPKKGGFILCAHHISALDPIIYALRVPQQLNFMAKQELFKNKFVSFIISHLGAFPVDRGSGDTSALSHAEDIVKKGQVLAIFPEGTRSKDGKLLKFKLGAIYIASLTGADIVPATIMIDNRNGKKLHFRSKITVRYGKLIPHDALQMSKDDRRSMSRATKIVWNAVNELTEGKIA